MLVIITYKDGVRDIFRQLGDSSGVAIAKTKELLGKRWEDVKSCTVQEDFFNEGPVGQENRD